MPYGVNDIVGQITELRKTNPAAAYALYNGASGMGAQGLVDTGALTTALRNSWGEADARDFVATGTRKYGNTNFDPTTGQWSGMGEAQGQGGTIAGWDPSQFSRNAPGLTSINYTPGTSFAGGTPNGTLLGANPLGTRPGGSTTPGAPNGTATQRPGATTNPGNPYQAPGSPTATTRPGGTGVAPLGTTTAPPGAAGPPGTTTAPPPGTPPGTTAPPGTSTPKNPQRSATLEQKARQILGSYFKTKPDGTPDWDAMSNTTDFYNSLPASLREQVTAEHLGAAMRTEAGLPLMPGMSLPGWYGDAGSGVVNGQYVRPTSATPTYQAPTYTAPPAQAVSPGNVMDFFDDDGYQFRLKEGNDAINNSLAARGGVLSGNAVKAGEKYASGLASDEYKAAFDRFTNTRNFNRSVYQDDRDTGRRNFESDRTSGRHDFEDTRDSDRANYQDDRNFDFSSYKDLRDFMESQSRDRRNFDEDKSRNDRDFGESGRRFNLGFDRDTAVSDRDYDEMARRFNLTFDRDTSTADRAFQYGTLKDLANMGLSGSSSNATIMAALAALFSQNTTNGANAGAAGTIGQSNATNTLISQILAQINGNNLVNSTTRPKP